MNSTSLRKKSPSIAAFLLSAIQACIIATSFSFLNDLGMYFFYTLPAVVALLFILYLIDVNCSQDEEVQISILAGDLILSFFTFPIFLGIFFGIFHPTHSLTYEKIENCQVIGQATMAQAVYEVYTILYVNFQYDNKEFLGYACTSDQVTNYQNYLFIAKGDRIACDAVGDSYDTPYNKRLRQLYSLYEVEESQFLANRNRGLKNKNRQLRERGSCYTGNKGAKFSNYNYSNSKLPSWMCMPRNSETYEELTKPRTCYVNFVTERVRSYNNSRDRLNLREVYYYAIIEFSLPVYYPKAGLICLFIFTYIPANLLLYGANWFLISFIINYSAKLFEKLEQKSHWLYGEKSKFY